MHHCVDLRCTCYVALLVYIRCTLWVLPVLHWILTVHISCTQGIHKWTDCVHYICSVICAHLACKCSESCTTLTHRVVQISLLSDVVRTCSAPFVHHVRQEGMSVENKCRIFQESAIILHRKCCRGKFLCAKILDCSNFCEQKRLSHSVPRGNSSVQNQARTGTASVVSSYKTSGARHGHRMKVWLLIFLAHWWMIKPVLVGASCCRHRRKNLLTCS